MERKKKLRKSVHDDDDILAEDRDAAEQTEPREILQ